MFDPSDFVANLFSPSYMLLIFIGVVLLYYFTRDRRRENRDYTRGE